MYVTVKEVPANIEITQVNISDYFRLEDRPESVIPEAVKRGSLERGECPIMPIFHSTPPLNHAFLVDRLLKRITSFV